MLKGYLTLELTHSRIRYIFLSRDPQGYKIFKSGIVSQVLNIQAPGELCRTLQDLIQREEIDPVRLFVTICLQENHIRQVDVPRINRSKIEEEINEELKKSPVFSQRKYDLIFDVVFRASDQGNLVFAAIDQSVLDYILSECHSLGVPFGHLEIAPLNLKEIFPLIESDVENHTVLFINDHVSYLMMASGGQWRFISRSTIGVEHLYPLTNDKLNHTYFINLAGDLKRVISSYISQHKIEKLDKLWIIWDQHGAANLASALAEKLNMDIQPLNLERLKNFDLGLEAKSANPVDLICVLPAVIFLERIKEQFRLNHFFRSQQYKTYVVNLLLTSLLVLGVVGFVLGVKSRDYYLQQKKLTIETQAFISAIEHFKNNKEKFYRLRDDAVGVRKALLEHLKPVNALNRVNWSIALAVFIQEMPPKMALSSFKFDETGQVSFSGETLDVNSINEFVNRLEKSAVFEDGLIDSYTERNTARQKVFVFRIMGRLREKRS